MCGIFGCINLNGFFTKEDYHRFIHLTEMVSYRGPNASGYVILNIKKSANENYFDAFLGHKRLSIIDLTNTANQPMEDKGVWIIFNGEIFNYLELKEELKKDGFIFNTNSDTEVILKLYRKYGESGFEKLNGMWAFAIVDLPKKKVVLSRDRFSIKPLYYTQINGQFYFASEIKQLLPLIQKKEINPNIMYNFLQQGLLDYNNETFFSGIYKLEPKTNLIIRLIDKKIDYKKYWDYTIEDIPNINYAVDKFREIFIDSVKIRLRSDVKVGALLSGGLDSSSITVIANHIQNGNFESFSIVSKDKKYSEEKFIDILCKTKNIKNQKLYFEPDIALSTLEEVIYHNDEPFCGLSVVAQYNILKKIKEETDIVVVLSGQGGDETLMGYLKYFFFNLKELIKQKSLISALAQIFLSLLNRTVIWQFNIKEAKRYIPYIDKDKNYLKIKGILEPIWQCNNIRERQILDIDKYSVPALTHYEDRNSMAHSLEIRLPFLDHRLVNLLLSLPPQMKIRNGWTKYILRKSLFELPNDIRWRRDKQGFITPEEKWLKRDLREIIENAFKRSILAELGIIDNKLFLNYYYDFQNNKRNIWYADITRTFIAELWARIFIGNQQKVEEMNGKEDKFL
ncbi:asparagine synthase (glutamine-hydrolyzing) [Thermodesulfovibrio sp. TK110]